MTDHDGGRLRFTAKSGKAEPMAIQPALTAEEWARVSVPHPNFDDLLTGKEDADDVFRAVALFNAALHDDPRKITRADVERLDAVCDVVAGEFGGEGSDTIFHCRQIAAKLAALLPPDA